MTLPKGGAPPPKKDAAASAATEAAGGDAIGNQQHLTTSERNDLSKKLRAIAPGGELYEFLPEQPSWYRRLGEDLERDLISKRLAVISGKAQKEDLRPRDRDRLNFVHELAQIRRHGAKIGAAYRGPTHQSINEAREALSVAFDQVLRDMLDYNANAMPMSA